MEVTGQVTYVNPVKTPSETKPDFKVQEFGISNKTEINFQMVEKPFGFQCAGERISKLVGVGLGDTVKVVFGIRGTVKDKTGEVGTPLNPTNRTTFTSLDAFDVVIVEKAVGGATAAAPVPDASAAPSSAPAATSVPDDLPF